jgi:tagatose-1,6-bisphosphate aldolase
VGIKVPRNAIECKNFPIYIHELNRHREKRVCMPKSHTTAQRERSQIQWRTLRANLASDVADAASALYLDELFSRPAIKSQ